MSFEKAKNHLVSLGLGDNIREFSESTATVALAAAALSTEEARIAKTLAFILDATPILILMAGDVKLDNRKYKDFFQKKAVMMTREELATLVGHEPGGVCPFGIKEGVRVYLDKSILRFDYVFPAVGSAGSAVRLTLEELERASGYIEWIDVSKSYDN